MKVREIKVKVYLLKDISSIDVTSEISKFIDSALGKDERWKKFHEDIGYKMYNFNQFWPIEKDKIYKKGALYVFNIRTVNDELSENVFSNLNNHSTDSIKGIVTESRIIPKKLIEKIYNITPVILKTENGYWKENISLEEFERRIFENLVKKYNDYSKNKIDEDFQLYNSITFLNKKPIKSHYKEISLLGDKLSLEISEDEMAQKIAYFSLGVGIGEMNSRGYGYCNYRWY
ncbi:CRISPR-associated endoribonuclease Cas6 [Peptostreptococcus russellii]|uniref:CRISPR-associated endoribonuclease Cas6 n=1 Tax=Peptostreptococcus russellii TaxID=215200 RepID=UPI0016267C94|nr:CRISPR-associated endoribonuclease Cas6 [Peptostreptococcus russellii]MBC2578595.1 CRISPR-associated endoribonuclease Cas6 [Peptostreptococcus russellii]